MTNDTIDRRVASGCPGSRAGLLTPAAIARLRRSPSRSSIALTPTAAFSWKTNPALIDSMIAGCRPLTVDGVVEVAMLCRVHEHHRAASRDGTRLVNNSRRTASTPGVPGPPTNLWGDMKTASR